MRTNSVTDVTNVTTTMQHKEREDGAEDGQREKTKQFEKNGPGEIIVRKKAGLVVSVESGAFNIRAAINISTFRIMFSGLSASASVPLLIQRIKP